MKKLLCACGQEVILNYHDATETAKSNDTNDDLDLYYQWMCRFCGRIYLESQPEPIVIASKRYTKEEAATDTIKKVSDLQEKSKKK
jgi:hypothetical protein